ncbi:membrane protein [Streptomyces alboflavus]|uniref:Membrane protein n=1 Tax=Streptomyces alboflavus TaxID=67267 RepID=A0A1Z1WCE6_9ACTN|nr:membrane protein [Streptomyces alboflavus]
MVKPDSDEAVRSGGPGFLHAWLPLGGALLLAAVVVAGGLRLNRVAGVLALAGGIQLSAAFAALSL